MLSVLTARNGRDNYFVAGKGFFRGHFDGSAFKMRISAASCRV
jgi:hypothetical protein